MIFIVINNLLFFSRKNKTYTNLIHIFFWIWKISKFEYEFVVWKWLDEEGCGWILKGFCGWYYGFEFECCEFLVNILGLMMNWYLVKSFLGFRGWAWMNFEFIIKKMWKVLVLWKRNLLDFRDYFFGFS